MMRGGLGITLFTLVLYHMSSATTIRISADEEPVLKSTFIKLSVMTADRFHPGHFLLANLTHIHSLSPGGESQILLPNERRFSSIKSLTFISDDTLLIGDPTLCEIYQLKNTSGELTLSMYVSGLCPEALVWLEIDNSIAVLQSNPLTSSMFTINERTRTKMTAITFNKAVGTMFADTQTSLYKFLFVLKPYLEVVDGYQNVIFNNTQMSKYDLMKSCALLTGINGLYFYYINATYEIYVIDGAKSRYTKLCQNFAIATQNICKGKLSYLTVVNGYLYVQRQDSLQVYRYKLAVIDDNNEPMVVMVEGDDIPPTSTVLKFNEIFPTTKSPDIFGKESPSYESYNMGLIMAIISSIIFLVLIAGAVTCAKKVIKRRQANSSSGVQRQPEIPVSFLDDRVYIPHSSATPSGQQPSQNNRVSIQGQDELPPSYDSVVESEQIRPASIVKPPPYESVVSGSVKDGVVNPSYDNTTP